MLGGDQYIADRIMAKRVEEHLRLAEHRRKTRDARSSTKASVTAGRMWLSQQVNHLLRRLRSKSSAPSRKSEGRNLPERLRLKREAGNQN